jgi:hypothetical protein
VTLLYAGASVIAGGPHSIHTSPISGSISLTEYANDRAAFGWIPSGMALTRETSGKYLSAYSLISFISSSGAPKTILLGTLGCDIVVEFDADDVAVKGVLVLVTGATLRRRVTDGALVAVAAGADVVIGLEVISVFLCDSRLTASRQRTGNLLEHSSSRPV